MIKKFNIFLVVVFVLLLGLKGLNEIRAARERDVASPDTPSDTSQEPSLPPPNVYYLHWSYFANEDPISNRNGILLDVVRAIFPGAKFKLLRGSPETFVEKLRTDSRAIVLGYGHHPAFKGCLAAPTPLGYGKFILMTLRSNPWRYTGPESLDKVRILMSIDYLDYSILRERHEKLGPDSPLLRVLPQSTTPMELAVMVEEGMADAFVTGGDQGDTGGIALEAMSVKVLQHFRKSPEVGRDDILLYVSSLDKDYSKHLVDAYEAGIRRIDESGERRRIFAYYGMTPPPIKK